MGVVNSAPFRMKRAEPIAAADNDKDKQDEGTIKSSNKSQR